MANWIWLFSVAIVGEVNHKSFEPVCYYYVIITEYFFSFLFCFLFCFFSDFSCKRFFSDINKIIF